MPQLRQPRTLQDISIEKYVNLYCGAFERRNSKLCAAASSSSSAYRNTEQSVLAECSEITRILSELPYFLTEMMSPQLVRKFAKLIENYYRKIFGVIYRFWDEQIDRRLCVAMFRSVLTPYLYKHDRTVGNEFIEHLIRQTLDSVPGLRTLRLTILPLSEGNSPQIVRMICHLRHLQVFACKHCCTDEVIEQLGLHCHNLKEISVCDSSSVTNASVQHLLQLRKLESLRLIGTSIDTEHYGMLLSELPIVKNIECTKTQENILDHVAEEKLHKISHVRGIVRDISSLAQRCPNITTLTIRVWNITGDLSGLAALTTLRTMRIEGGDYATSNLNVVLTGIGPRLTNLTLYEMRHVNLQDIVTLCPSLTSLSLLYCTLLPLDQNTQLDPQLPHFRNLTSLHIYKTSNRTNFNYIRHYVRLETIDFQWINVSKVEFMRELVRSGTLANLKKFRVDEREPGALNMEALQLLIQHCPHLRRIEDSTCWPLIDADSVQELKRELSVQNLDLETIY